MNYAIVLSGGQGLRLGAERPKQYIEVKGKPVFLYALQTLGRSRYIDRIVIVAEESWQEYIRLHCGGISIAAYALPGRNRQESIYHGLLAVKELGMRQAAQARAEADGASDNTVLIQDAARPFLTEEMIANYYAALEGYDGVLPVLPMKDTIYASEDGMQISKLLDRSQLYSGQAPEIFDFRKYLAANEALLPTRILEINGSSEAAVLGGMRIHMVSGEEQNFKITTKEDLKRFEQLLT